MIRFAGMQGWCTTESKVITRTSLVFIFALLKGSEWLEFGSDIVLLGPVSQHNERRREPKNTSFVRLVSNAQSCLSVEYDNLS